MSKEYVKKDWRESRDYKHRLAAKGEDVTANYMEKEKSMRIVGRNIRFSFGELDIIGISGRYLCFVEVKTRSNLKHGRPSLALSSEKQRRIRRLVQLYLRFHREYSMLSPRIDVSEVLIIKDEAYINYIENAF